MLYVVCVQAEALVSTVPEDLNMSIGPLSKAILQAAGQEVQAELRRRSQTLHFGEYVLTSSGSLRAQGVRSILHTTLPFWDNQHKQEHLGVCTSHLTYSSSIFRFSRFLSALSFDFLAFFLFVRNSYLL